MPLVLAGGCATVRKNLQKRLALWLMVRLGLLDTSLRLSSGGC